MTMKFVFFLGVFLDVHFSNDKPASSVSIVVQAAGSIRSPNEYVSRVLKLTFLVLALCQSETLA